MHKTVIHHVLTNRTYQVNIFTIRHDHTSMARKDSIIMTHCKLDGLYSLTVSYTHLKLPTNREV